jgi:hypothetical protein
MYSSRPRVISIGFRVQGISVFFGTVFPTLNPKPQTWWRSCARAARSRRSVTSSSSVLSVADRPAPLRRKRRSHCTSSAATVRTPLPAPWLSEAATAAAAAAAAAADATALVLFVWPCPESILSVTHAAWTDLLQGCRVQSLGFVDQGSELRV